MTDQQIVREWDPAVGKWVTKAQAEAGGGGSLPEGWTQEGDPADVATNGGGLDFAAGTVQGDGGAVNFTNQTAVGFGTAGDASMNLEADAASLIAPGVEGATARLGLYNAENAIRVVDFDGAGETRIGFYGATPAACPEVPAAPTEQNIVDALVALGLVTQAAP